MKGLSVLCLAAGLMFGLAPAAEGRPLSGPVDPGLRSAKPEVLCLNESAGRFVNRIRPQHCEFYDAAAPGSEIITAAGFPARNIRWTHWGHTTAVGRGEYWLSGRWLTVRLKLRRPAATCGQRVFTEVRMNIRICPGNWTGWERPVAIKHCL